jgi:cytochrome c oxidase cbb3-type subunit 4
MNVYTMISIATTVLSFLLFLGIVAWAYGKGRRRAFDEAANAPFALPDDIVGVPAASRRNAEREA